LVKNTTPLNFKKWCKNPDKTLIMGVLNITPDSFSDGGKYFSKNSAIKHALKLINEGSDIIDVGGESTRPGASPLTIEEEITRVIPVIKEIRKLSKNILISIDTYKSEVAKEAVKYGANIINDISGLVMDDRMVHIAAELDVPVIIMHLKGTPMDMQVNPTYENLISEITEFLRTQIQYALKNGVKKHNIIIDPGIGFGKTIEHNFKIIANLEKFKKIGFPILIGPSRKSFIGNLLKLPPDKRLEGTAASIAIGIVNGARIVRVHDVLEMKRVSSIADKVNEVT